MRFQFSTAITTVYLITLLISGIPYLLYISITSNLFDKHSPWHVFKLQSYFNVLEKIKANYCTLQIEDKHSPIQKINLATVCDYNTYLSEGGRNFSRLFPNHNSLSNASLTGRTLGREKEGA
jgi:hypothetical protein